MAQLAKEDVTDLYDRFLAKGAPQRKKIVVAYVSATHMKKLFDDSEVDFKAGANGPLTEAQFKRALKIGDDHGHVHFVESLEKFRTEAKHFPPQDEIMAAVIA